MTTSISIKVKLSGVVLRIQIRQSRRSVLTSVGGLAAYQNGSPTTIIGPPTSGTRVLNEFWRDALSGEWRCTVAGTPGTWLQIMSAAVTADRSSGTIPTGYLILNVTTNHIKRHDGGYVWQVPGA